MADKSAVRNPLSDHARKMPRPMIMTSEMMRLLSSVFTGSKIMILNTRCSRIFGLSYRCI